MAGKKKVELKPKSLLGFNRKQKICYNCMFRHKDTGYCPNKMDFVNYNDHCFNTKLFRYDFGIDARNDEVVLFR